MKKREKTLFIEFDDGTIKCAEHVTVKWATPTGYAYVQGNKGYGIKYIYPKKSAKIRHVWEEEM